MKNNNNNIKVCLFIANPLDKMGGLEKHYIELANHLCKYINITALAHYSYHKYLSKNINCIDPQLSNSRYNPFNYIKLYYIFKKNNFPIIHSQANKATYITSKLKKFFPKNKFIATIHNRKKRIDYFNKMDYVIGVSNFVTNQIKNTNKITIYNGIDTEKINHAKKIDLYKEFDIKNNYPILTGVGRFVKAKGFSNLILSIKDLNVNLLLVGDGPLKEELYKMVKQYKIKDKVFLTGYRDDALNIIKSSKAVIISSYNEGFSYVFAESLMLETPLISTNVADIKKFIPPNMICETNNTKDLKKTIQKFLEEPNQNLNKYYNLAKNKFSINTMTLETLKLYKRILDE